MSGGTSAFLYDEHLEGWQLTKVVYYQTSLKIHNDWIRTTDLWYRNWLLRQLSEGTALPTEPQPLPEKVTVWMSLNVGRTNVGPTNVAALSFTSFHRFDWFFCIFSFLPMPACLPAWLLRDHAVLSRRHALTRRLTENGNQKTFRKQNLFIWAVHSCGSVSRAVNFIARGQRFESYSQKVAKWNR